MTDSRLELIHDLLHQKAATARTFVQYIDSDREYIEGDKLYMREAHFVMAIGPGEGRTMSEIAQIMNVTQGAVSQTAARLEKKGYIRREKSTVNRRQTIALLTEKASIFMRSMRSTMSVPLPMPMNSSFTGSVTSNCAC